MLQLECEFLGSKRHILFIKFLFTTHNIFFLENEVSTYYVEEPKHARCYTVKVLGNSFNETTLVLNEKD